MNRAVALIVLATLTLLGCSGDDSTPRALSSSSTTTTAPASNDATSTTVPRYSGDPASAFCLAVVDDRPVLDPFEAGLDTREVELRLRALVVRSEQLAADAPPELADDVMALVDGLSELDEVLAEHDYDFGAAGEAGADLSFLEAPELVDVGARVAAYRRDVCEP